MSQQKLTISLEFPYEKNSIDLPIGTTFNLGKVQYRTVRVKNGRLAESCDGCMMSLDHCPVFRCTGFSRQDHHEVIFKITNLEDQL